MEREALYWIFSTAPQAIAAFVGLIFAGVSFMYSRIDTKIEADPTSKEIYDEIKIDMYNGLKMLLTLTFICLSFDIIYLLIIPYKKITPIIAISSSLLIVINIFTLAKSIFYICKVMDLTAFDKTANKLIKSNEDFHQKQSVPIGTYITNFIELEKILRNNRLFSDIGGSNRKPSTRQIIELLFKEGVINNEEASQLVYLHQLRNLAVHGDVSDISEIMNDTLLKYIKTIKSRLDK